MTMRMGHELSCVAGIDHGQPVSPEKGSKRPHRVIGRLASFLEMGHWHGLGRAAQNMAHDGMEKFMENGR